MDTKKMEVKTRYVSIEDRAFVLVKCTLDDDSVMYGTIPYTNIDDKGHMIKGMNGLEMCLASSIPSALEMRADDIKCEGMTPNQVIEYFKKKIGSVA